jgi:aerobic-type carbon monoxide dehydrogenase small subunit (CoxS/CutS family)
LPALQEKILAHAPYRILLPGFIVALKALLDQNPDQTGRSGSGWRKLCRCTGYDHRAL